MPSVRTRFAPSPTGYLHIGGARTALFNYLFARHAGGRFILRIEDTDRERSTDASIQAILDGMRWLGLDWDEGPIFQTQRLEIYAEHAERLLSNDLAYRCYCSAEELEAKRKAAMLGGRSPMYDRTCRHLTGPRPGLSVIRFKAPLDGSTVVADLVKGSIAFDNTEIDDLVLVRSDGVPTYNFCVVIDDATMAISHVLRGDDHLTNTPKQIQIYQALGYPLPAFGHLPQILGEDRTRLSKRHGATSVIAYRDMGFLPEALVNFLARLGWSHGDQEIFSRAELIEHFSLDHVGTSAGVYNMEKLEWLNAHNIKAMSGETLAAAIKPFIEAKGYRLHGDNAWLAQLALTLRERAKTLVDLVEQAHFYFVDTVQIDPAAAAKHLKPESLEILRALRARLADAPAFDHDRIKVCFDATIAQFSVGLGKLAQPVRIAVTGGTVSPGIFELLEVLGRERSIARIDRCLLTQEGSATP